MLTPVPHPTHRPSLFRRRMMVPLLVLLTTTTTTFLSWSDHSYIGSVSATQRPLWSRIRHHLPFLRDNQPATTYTPLIFFTVPKGLSSTNDEMERIVRQIERECDVQVERLDVLRHPENEAVLNMVTQSIRTMSPTIGSSSSTATSGTSQHPSQTIQPQPPLLYHRESRQIYQVLPSPTSSSSSKSSTSTVVHSSKPPYMDKEQIRAWAKGRYLSPFIASRGNDDTKLSKSSSSAPIVVVNENQSHDEEMNAQMEGVLDEMALSPEQLKGKRLMEERTRAKATTSSTK